MKQLKLNIIIGILLCIPLFSFGNTNIDSVLSKCETLFINDQYKAVIDISNEFLNIFEAKNQADSLKVGELFFNQFESYYALRQYQESIAAANNGLQFCPNDTAALELKSILYYKRAYGENALDFSLKSRASMLESIQWNETSNPINFDYLIGGYLFLSSDEANHGNLEEAERYLRLANKNYKLDKEAIDKEREGENGEQERYEVIIPYRHCFLIYALGTSAADSLKMEEQIALLKSLSEEPTFSKKHESIYYVTALFHAASWNVNKSEDSLVSEANLTRANYFIDEAIRLVTKENYVGYIDALQYEKCKILTLANDLDKAAAIINQLLSNENLPTTRKAVFLAQSALINAKQGNKEASIERFRKAIEQLHDGTDSLQQNLDNFEPNSSFPRTNILVRIAEKLQEYFPNDEGVQKLLPNIYAVALKQYKNSTLTSSYNPTYDETLREIIQGTLQNNKADYASKNYQKQEFLEQVEVLKNQLAWQQFNQNRLTNNLAEFDKFNATNLALRKQLTAAKKSNKIEQQDSLQTLLHQNEATLKHLYPNLELMTKADFKIEQLQDKLQKDDVILKYIVLSDKLAIYSITKSTIDLQLKTWTTDNEKAIKDFVSSIKSKKYDVQLAETIADYLFPKDIKAKKLIINPDAALFQLPFEVLRLDNQYLIEQYNIRYTSNLGFIEPDVLQNETNNKLAVYVPQYDKDESASNSRSQLGALVGAQREAAMISNYFHADIYNDASLDKNVFIETAANAQILHLAMHAEVNNETPELSKLLFSLDNEEEQLYLEEVYGLQLQADLVVLSACNTGVGEENAGRSLESFQRAFTFAGVPSAIASLWEVPDLATQEIMDAFYKNLKAGKTKSDALHQAKLSFLAKHKGSKLDQPYYWAGFVLYGKDGVIKANSNKMIWWILIGLVIVGIVLFRWLK